MNFKSSGFLLLAISVAVATVTACIAHAQVQVQPASAQGAHVVSPDFHLLNGAGSVVRYDSTTGLTQVLKNVEEGVPPFVLKKLAWQTFSDERAQPPRGQAGRYQVIVGNEEVGQLVRIDTVSSTTWFVNGKGRWSEMARP